MEDQPSTRKRKVPTGDFELEDKDDDATETARKIARTSASGRTYQHRPAAAPNIPDEEDMEEVWAPACVQREHDDAYSDHPARHSTPARAETRTPKLASGNGASSTKEAERTNKGLVAMTDTEEEAYMDTPAHVLADETEDEYVSGERGGRDKKGKGKAPLPGSPTRAQPKRKAGDISDTMAEGDSSSTDNAGSQLVLRSLVDTQQVGSALRLANATSSRFFGGASNTTINGGTFDASVHLHLHHEAGQETSFPLVAGSTMASGSTGHATIDLKIIFSPRLPPRPQWLIGRDDAVENIVSCILGAASERPARIAILGDGGLGKTTLVLRALHDERIDTRYGPDGRLFVSCEGATTPDLLIIALANGLHLEVAQRDSHILLHILHQLRSTVGILCLDNFETPWDPADCRRSVEDLLRHLAGISSLTLLITMRGTQRPSGIDWEPRFHPLPPLDSESAANMFSALSGQSTNPIDEHVQTLLEACEYIPLAISIVAQLVRDGESPQLLLQRWKEEGTSLLSTGVDSDRTSALDASIRLSVNSPRMRDVPSATQLLSMLAFLPTGILEMGNIMDRLISALPMIQIRRALHTLKRVALVHGPLSKSGTVSRYRLLSPIAEWTTRHLPLSDDICRAMAICYFAVMRASEYRAVVVPELLNIRTILHAALDRNIIQQQIMDAVLEYSFWAGYEESEDTVLGAILRATNPEGLPCDLGDLHNRLGDMHRLREDWREAETAVKAAVALHQQSQDILGEASDLRLLGSIFGGQGRHDDAQNAFDAALVLHRQAGYTSGDGDYQQSIGELHTWRGRLEDAQSAFEAAVVLHRQAGFTFDEATDQESLGQLHLQQGRLNDAQSAFEAALELYRQEQETSCEASIQQSLGKLHLRQGRLDEAQSALEAALVLHRQCQETRGEANSQDSLGRLYLQQGRLDKAQSAFEAAVMLYRQCPNCTLGEAIAQQNLGQLHIQQDRLDEAQSAFDAALVLYRQCQHTGGQAQAQQLLEDLRTRKEGTSTQLVS